MGGISVDGRSSPEIESVEEMVGRFQGELLTILPQWRDRLAAAPGELEQLERDVHEMHARGADLLVAGLAAEVMKRRDFEKAAKQTRKDYRYSLARGTNRKVRIRLLSGLVIWVASLYCAPRKSLFGRDEDNVPGLYIEQHAIRDSVETGPLCAGLDMLRGEDVVATRHASRLFEENASSRWAPCWASSRRSVTATFDAPMGTRRSTRRCITGAAGFVAGDEGTIVRHERNANSTPALI